MDKALDAGRHPAETLAFFRVYPGMKVAELGAGGGYTTELLARAVGVGGRVYGQNSQFILDRFAQKPWTERLALPQMTNVTRLDAPFDAPFPLDLNDLDLVVNVLFYHDTYWQEVDREAMNRAVFQALRPGGLYGIIDHSAREGDGATAVKTFHRVEEKLVRQEIEAAGFVLVDQSDFLRNPADTRDWNDAPGAAGDRRGTSDRFALLFMKPPLADSGR
ncbi:MAG: class I SAM-dependent methyltransferase [Deltaproteobacteria bacterium]|nr:class I SAM-dependent methyltransferase [Deltaproteobacteria bacterium]